LFLTEFIPSYSLTHNGDDAPQTYHLSSAQLENRHPPERLCALRYMEYSPGVWTALQDGNPQTDVAVVAVSWSLRYCHEDAWHLLSPSGIMFASLSRRSPRTYAAVVFGISTVGVVVLCKPQGFHRIVFCVSESG
jgi:hypothetical protein